MSTKTVHILHQGNALCGTMTHSSSSWPDGHKWIPLSSFWADHGPEHCFKEPCARCFDVAKGIAKPLDQHYANEIKKIKPETGDVIVARFPGEASEAAIDSLFTVQKQLYEIYGIECSMLVLENGADLSLVKEEKLAELYRRIEVLENGRD